MSLKSVVGFTHDEGPVNMTNMTNAQYREKISRRMPSLFSNNENIHVALRVIEWITPEDSTTSNVGAKGAKTIPQWIITEFEKNPYIAGLYLDIINGTATGCFTTSDIMRFDI